MKEYEMLDKRKLLTTALFGVAAILGIYSHGVYANEKPVYKCISNVGKIKFQDTACNLSDTAEVTNYTVGKEYKSKSGLRPQELVILDRIYQRQILELKLQNDVLIDKSVRHCGRPLQL
jgi:hypothetical protein